MTNQFDKNCQLFSSKNPRAAALLSFADAGSLKVVKQENGELNLHDRGIYYHAKEGAKKEAIDWAKSLPLSDVEVFVVFGIGLGYAYEAVFSWLKEKKERRLIFVEDDLRVIQCFLESERAQKILEDRQVQLFHIEDSEEGLHVLQGIAWGAFGKMMRISSLPAYKMHRRDVLHEIETRLQYESSEIHAVLDEYVTHGTSYFRNFWKNLFLIPGSTLGNNLFRAFTGCPAIVVGAGPSLAKHYKRLAELRDKALIFAGGSSVNALVEHGIMPHFGGGIDPNATQYLRLRQGLGFQVPYFYRSRMLHEATELITGERLYLRGGDGYNISDWFEKRLGIKGKILGGGHSIANFQIEIAHALGCNPIILVGFDLAYGADLQTYAPGVEQATARQDEVVAWKNHQGEQVNTAWKWIVESKWIEDFAKKHRKTKLINATEGGLGVQGIPHMSLDATVAKYLHQSCDYDALVHTAIQDAGYCKNDPKSILKGCGEMYDSLERVKQYIDELYMTVEKGKNLNEPLSCLETPQMIMLDGKFKREIAYRYILEVFERMRIKLEHNQLEFFSHATMEEKEKKQLEAEMLLKRFVFLKEVAIVNQILIAQSIRLEQNEGLDISSFHPKSEVLWT